MDLDKIRQGYTEDLNVLNFLVGFVNLLEEHEIDKLDHFSFKKLIDQMNKIFDRKLSPLPDED